MDLNDLRLLLRIVNEGSVQGAAKKLRVSRTTLRRRLQRLEDSVGAPLLLQGPQGVTLTAAGEVCERRGRSLLRQADTMITDAKASEHLDDTTVRLVIPVGASHEARLRAFQMLRTAAPKIRLDVHEVEEPLEAIEEPFDLMVHYGAPPPKMSWFSRVIFHIRICALASPRYLERHGAPQCLEDLANHPIILWKRKHKPLDSWPLKGGGSVPIAPVLITGNLMFAHEACRKGMGLLLGVRELPLHEELCRDLIPVLPDIVGEEETLRALSPHGSATNSRARAILSNIMRFLELLPNN